mgnify:CR=1 FL=1
MGPPAKATAAPGSLRAVATWAAVHARAAAWSPLAAGHNVSDGAAAAVETPPKAATTSWETAKGSAAEDWGAGDGPREGPRAPDGAASLGTAAAAGAGAGAGAGTGASPNGSPTAAAGDTPRPTGGLLAGPITGARFATYGPAQDLMRLGSFESLSLRTDQLPLFAVTAPFVAIGTLLVVAKWRESRE